MKIDYTLYSEKWNTATVEAAERQHPVNADLISRIGLPREGKILDIGCGLGFLVYSFERLGYENVEGIDVSETQIGCARRITKKVSCIADVSAFLKARAAQFTCITAIDVLEHIQKDEVLRTLHAIRGALVPGGVFFARVPNANSSFSATHLYNDWTHQTNFNEYSLEFILKNAGFERIQIRGYRRPEVMSMTRPFGILRRGVGWCFQTLRRAEAIAVFGSQRGRRMPLTLDITARCQNPG